MAQVPQIGGGPVCQGRSDRAERVAHRDGSSDGPTLAYVCAERLTPALLPTAQQLARWEELDLTDQVAGRLAIISWATVQRLLQRFQIDTPKLPRRKPQPPNGLLRQTPMERLSWATQAPGSFETDPGAPLQADHRR